MSAPYMMKVDTAARPFSPETLAERWECSADTVRALCNAGKLHSFRLGRLIRIPAQEVARYECQTIESSSTATNSASLTPTQNEGAYVSRLVRQTEGLPSLALVKCGEQETARRVKG